MYLQEVALKIETNGSQYNNLILHITIVLFNQIILQVLLFLSFFILLYLYLNVFIFNPVYHFIGLKSGIIRSDNYLNMVKKAELTAKAL